MGLKYFNCLLVCGLGKFSLVGWLVHCQDFIFVLVWLYSSRLVSLFLMDEIPLGNFFPLLFPSGKYLRFFYGLQLFCVYVMVPLSSTLRDGSKGGLSFSNLVGDESKIS